MAIAAVLSLPMRALRQLAVAVAHGKSPLPVASGRTEGREGPDYAYGYSWYGQCCGGGWSWGAWFGFSCGFPAYDYHPYDYPYYHDPSFAQPLVATPNPPAFMSWSAARVIGEWPEEEASRMGDGAFPAEEHPLSAQGPLPQPNGA
ncbi:MAG TPA: hypothetical protein VKY65_00035 [Alphaproteobacteria bacterium]|nr:hypothetical protein [Alphaproteobacteria bacterium]